MTIDSAATFLASSVLIGGGIVVLIACAVAVNQLLVRFWKPVTLFTFPEAMTQKIAFTEPHLEQHDTNHSKP